MATSATVTGLVTYVDITNCTITITDDQGEKLTYDFPNDQNAVAYYTYHSRRVECTTEDGAVKEIKFTE
jgi:FtsP/CotA-like multicopper oxidase with cupredoxin domain